MLRSLGSAEHLNLKRDYLMSLTNGKGDKHTKSPMSLHFELMELNLIWVGICFYDLFLVFIY